MKYAVVAHSGRQFKIKEGDVVDVDLMKSQNPDASYTFDHVLLVVDEGKSYVGSPTVSEAKVTAKVIGQVKGTKIRVAKFKSKVRYRRVTGFRPQYTQVKIEKIVLK